MNARVVSCPQCGEDVEWHAGNPCRPFCSARCRSADLGAWATESYRIPVQENDGEIQSEPDEAS